MCGSCILHGRLSESKTLLPWVSRTLDTCGLLLTNKGHPILCRWLGQNSKATKFKRLLTDMRSQMRLQTSANAYEIRENYVPTMTKRIFNYLANVCTWSFWRRLNFSHMDNHRMRLMKLLKPWIHIICNATHWILSMSFVWKKRSQ